MSPWKRRGHRRAQYIAVVLFLTALLLLVFSIIQLTGTVDKRGDLTPKLFRTHSSRTDR